MSNKSIYIKQMKTSLRGLLCFVNKFLQQYAMATKGVVDLDIPRTAITCIS